MGGIPPMWRDVMYCHEQRPIHVMIGGGDQLYCDDVWNLPALAQWLQLPDLAQRLAHPFTQVWVPINHCPSMSHILKLKCHPFLHNQDMADQVEWFYFTSYVKHWTQSNFSDALGSIPQVTGSTLLPDCLCDSCCTGSVADVVLPLWY